MSPMVDTFDEQQRKRFPTVMRLPATQTGNISPDEPKSTATPLIRPAQQMSKTQPVEPATPAAQQELNRLTTGPESRTGAEQVRNKPLRILSRIGSGILDAVLPAVSINVPGTGMRHALKVHEARRGVEQEDELANTAAKRNLENEQALEVAARPEHRAQMAQVAGERVAATNDANRIREEHGKTTAELARVKQEQQNAALLRKQGMMMGDGGAIVPIPREQMSELELGVLDLQAARKEEIEATAELRAAQAANEPAKVKIAQDRLAASHRIQSNIERRLNLSERQFELRSQGTIDGVAAPGTMIADDGRPIGTAMQQNVRPTGQQRNKADMGGSAKEQLADMREIVNRRKDVFGPIGGRLTTFDNWIGSSDPDAKAFLAAQTIAADHLAGTFGGRSETALRELHAATGNFKDTPEAILRGLDQIDKANDLFIKRGTARTTGSVAAGNPQQPKRPAGVPPDAVFDPATKRWRGK